MVDGITQHVFEGRHHTLPERYDDFGFAVDDQVDLLAQLAGHLPDYPLEARQHRSNGTMRAHQAFLQLRSPAPVAGPGHPVARSQGRLEVEQVRCRLEQAWTSWSRRE